MPAARPARELITVPILSDEGGLVIPVRVNDREAAAIVTPRASYTYILKPDGLDLTRGMPVRSVGLTGDEDGYWTDLDMLKLGTAVVHGAPAIVIDRPDLPTLDGRGVIMSIGYDIIGNYATLIDLPGRRLSLFRHRPHGCQDLRGLFTGPTYDAPLQMSPTGQTDIVDVTLNGKIVEMQISNGSNVSIISTRDARRAGVSGQDAASDTQVRTEASRVGLGYRRRFETLSLGGYIARRPQLDVDPRITYNPLGLDFFKDKLVLLDFPGERMTFQTSRGTTPDGFRTGSDRFGTVQTKNVSVSVTDGPGR